MKVSRKTWSGSSRGRLAVSLLLGFASALVIHAQETVNVADASAATEEDAFLSEPFEDYIDLDGSSEVVKTAEETVSEDYTTEASPTTSTTPEIKPADDEKQDARDVVQKGPFIDLLGPNLLSLVLTGENTARFEQNLTNDALSGKTVVGLYFSADWCGPCRQFTPELVRFYDKMNAKRGKKNQFQIVWISRCRDVNAYTQYFAQMPGWAALPPEEAMGERGQMLGNKFGVKGIPSLVLLDDLGSVITTDARNMVPKDMNGIGFPWRNPIATLYITIVPRSLRLMIKTHIDTVITQVFRRIKSVFARPKARPA